MTKKFRNTMIGIAAAYILFGFVLILWPEASRKIVCYVLGAAALLYGIYRIIAYFLKGQLPATMQFGVAIGTAFALAGLFLLLKANTVVAAMAFLIGICVVIDSVLRMQIALDIRRMGGTNWAPVLICALCMLAIGLLLFFNPFTVVTTATIIAGIALVIDGGLTIWSLVKTSQVIKDAAQPAARVK